MTIFLYFFYYFGGILLSFKVNLKPELCTWVFVLLIQSEEIGEVKLMYVYLKLNVTVRAVILISVADRRINR